MSNDERAYLKAQIHDNLRLRDTQDLLEIWQRDDHEEWTDLAFEVVREILVERLGEIPAREPVEQDEEQDAPEIAVNRQPAVEAQAADITNFMRQQTYETLDEKDTDVLIEIWREADHQEWNEMAFDVMRQILLERIGKLPAQDPPRPQRIRAVSAPDQGIYLDPDPAGPDLFNLSFKPITLVALRCPDCGKPIDEQDRVCPHCGVDLEAPLGEAELQSLAAEHFEKAREIYEQGRDFKGALAECDQALEFTPDSARLHNLRGLILDAQGKTALAVREYREALQLEPGLAEARDNLTDAQSELRKYRA